MKYGNAFVWSDNSGEYCLIKKKDSLTIGLVFCMLGAFCLARVEIWKEEGLTEIKRE